MIACVAFFVQGLYGQSSNEEYLTTITASDSTIEYVIDYLKDHPLHVPSGELSLLNTYFGISTAELPCDPLLLSKYNRWDPEDIVRFFIDYPLLVPFKNILSFHQNPLLFQGELFLSKPVGSSDASYRWKSRLRIARTIDAQFLVNFRDSTMSVSQRSLRFGRSTSQALTIGNYSLDSDYDLWYGYFPALTQIKGLKSLFFGTQRKYNGLVYTNHGTNSFHSLLLFSHVLPYEQIYGAHVEFDPLSLLLIKTGFSVCKIDSLSELSDDTTHFVSEYGYIFNSKVSVKRQRIHYDLSGGIDITAPHVPVVRSELHSHDSPYGWNIGFVFGPKNMLIARSSFFQEIVRYFIPMSHLQSSVLYLFWDVQQKLEQASVGFRSSYVLCGQKAVTFFKTHGYIRLSEGGIGWYQNIEWNGDSLTFFTRASGDVVQNTMLKYFFSVLFASSHEKKIYIRRSSVDVEICFQRKITIVPSLVFQSSSGLWVHVQTKLFLTSYTYCLWKIFLSLTKDWNKNYGISFATSYGL